MHSGFERPRGALQGVIAHQARARTPEPSHALLLLGEVGELEIKTEGADEHLGPMRVDGIELRGQHTPTFATLRPAEVDGGTPDSLHEIEQRLAFLLHDDLTEERAQELDLARQRVAGTRGPDAPGLGTDGCVGSDLGSAHLPVRLPCADPGRYLRVHHGRHLRPSRSVVAG